jgi:hypothetical protein
MPYLKQQSIRKRSSAAIEVDFFLRHKHTNNYAINTRAYLLLMTTTMMTDEVVSCSSECWSDFLQ